MSCTIDLKKARQETAAAIERAKNPRKKEIVRVLYPERFPPEKGFIAFTIPLTCYRLRHNRAALVALREESSGDACIDGDADERGAITFVVSFPMLDPMALAQEARKRADRLTLDLGVPTLVVKRRGRRAAILRRLGVPLQH